MTKTQRIDDWVWRRKNDLDSREFSNSLRTVGFHKPLGQLSYPKTWRGFYALLVANFSAKLRFLNVAFVDGGEAMRLYVWHDLALNDLLTRHHGLLTLEHVPLDPVCFIDWIRGNVVPGGTPMYDLIADAYGDKLNPLRSDVLPDVDKGDLFDAYFARWGEPDPVLFYYRQDVATKDMTGSVQGTPGVPPAGLPPVQSDREAWFEDWAAGRAKESAPKPGEE